MNLAQQALAVHNLGRARLLLDRHRPAAGTNSSAAPDLRGWEWRYLWAQTRPSPHFKLVQLTNYASEISMSGDGSLLAVSADREVLVYDMRTRERLLRLADESNTAEPWAVFAQSSPLLALARRDGPHWHVELWDPVRQKQLRVIPTPEIMRLHFSRGDQQIITLSPAGRRQCTLSAWNVTDGTKAWQRTFDYPIANMSQTSTVSKDGTLGAITGRSGQLTIFKTSDGSEITSITATDEYVTALAFSPDNSKLVSGAGYTDSAIRVWDVATGNLLDTLQGHRSWVSSFAFSSDGTELLSSSADQTVRRWDFAARKETAVFRGHQSEVYGVVIGPGNAFATRSKDGAVCIWDTEERGVSSERRTFPRKILYACFVDHGRSIFTFEDDFGAALWDSQTLRLKRQYWESLPKGQIPVPSPSGKHVALVKTTDGAPPVTSFRIINLSTMEESGELLEPGEVMMICCRSSDGTTVFGDVSVNGESRVVVWDFATARRISSGKSTLKRILYDTGGVNAFVRCDATSIEIYDVFNPATPKWTLPQASVRCTAMTFLPKRDLAIAAYQGGLLQVYDLKTSRPIRQIEGFLLGVHSVVASPDQKRIAAASNGAEAIKLWETDGWQEVLTLSAPGSLFDCIEFSPDGRLLMGGNVRQDLFIWSAPGFDEIEAMEASDKAGGMTQ